MNSDYRKKLYLRIHNSFFEKILLKKRKEILFHLKEFVNDKNIRDVLDVGTTQDDDNESSNYLIKNFGIDKNYKSISDQSITSNFFSKTLKKSITDDFTKNEIDIFQSDLVISNATIEHVGSFNNQIKMFSNIINLSRKYFIITTPNRFHPIEFHTKIPFIHWLPKKFYTKLLKLFGLNFFANEENLNLLSEIDLKLIMKKFNHIKYEIKYIKFCFIKSNIILIGRKY
jgi:hypothetical protein